MQDDESDQSRIRNRAYEIWDTSGRPEGEHMSHWQQALAELGLVTPITPTDESPAEDPAMPDPDTTQPEIVAPGAEALIPGGEKKRGSGEPVPIRSKRM